MSTYKMVELVGTSKVSLEDAIQAAVASASETSAVRWFQVVEIRGAADVGKVQEWQVTVKMGVQGG
jgi:dodecin